ncbi:hypothetical protein GCM10011514_34230 [Emticicia aquatilis]|uniref:Lipoprotein n=1 Tax=Emticicia aquatilis TaxID=1537369 RepID=A0A916YYP1_9BACT|nr:hypothetical protein [Emticicia aquatilis]GGD67302.1 hypothetical protein GCM10011514_34230 [Emticicia aquatilis]
MKTSFYRTGALVLSLTTLGLLSCEKNESLVPNSTTNQTTTFDVTKSHTTSPFVNESLQNVGSDKILAAACENYSLVLSGVTATPHAGGLDSYLANVDMVTGATTAASAITVGGLIVKSVTGITKIPAAAPTLYAVTGMNSSIPRRLLRVNPATGVSVNVGATVSAGAVIALQDIEYCTTNARYYAIMEGTNRIMISPDALNWTLLAVAPTNFRLNGLTFQKNAAGVETLWVIAGQANTLCGGKFGDMFNYTLGGAFIANNSYNAATAGPVTPELGLDFYQNTACVIRNFVVGSASGFLSHNMTLCSGGGIPAPIGGSGIKATYDFAKR